MRRVTLHHIAMFLRFCLKRNASLIPELPTYLPQAGWAGLSLVCQAGIGAVQAQKQALWMSVTLDMHNKTLRNKRVYYTYKYIYMYIYIKPWEWHIEAMTQCWNGASWARTQTGPATYGPKLSTSGFPVTGKAERRKKLWRVQMSFHCRGSWLLKSYCIKLSHNILMHLECIFPNHQHIIHVNMGISRNFHYKPSSYWGSHG